MGPTINLLPIAQNIGWTFTPKSLFFLRPCNCVVTYIFQFFRYLKVSLVPSVSPSNWSFTSKAMIVNSSESPVVIADNFPVAMTKAKLSKKH